MQKISHLEIIQIKKHKIKIDNLVNKVLKNYIHVRYTMSDTIFFFKIYIGSCKFVQLTIFLQINLFAQFSRTY